MRSILEVMASTAPPMTLQSCFKSWIVLIGSVSSHLFVVRKQTQTKIALGYVEGTREIKIFKCSSCATCISTLCWSVENIGWVDKSKRSLENWGKCRVCRERVGNFPRGSKSLVSPPSVVTSTSYAKICNTTLTDNSQSFCSTKKFSYKRRR